jgi:ADP-ribose pyrophosphatase YjhB (NUDIX family)
MTSPRWHLQALRLAALSQNGLTFMEDPFDRDRWEEVRRIAAEMLAAGAGTSPEEIAAGLSQEHGYATPKVDVRAAVFREDQVLLVQERSDGRWTLPGGWCDVGEAPGVAAAREVEEESGYRVRTTKLLAVFDKLRHGHPPATWHAYKLFFRCELTGGAPAASVETSAVGFFGEHDLPPLSLGRVTEAQIRRMFEHARDASLPTDYD